MADVFDKATRSWVMSRIRGEDTQPELRVRRHLHAAGLRFRIHDNELPGRPDIKLTRWKCVVFVHGCYWHRHPGCPKATNPATDAPRWAAKFQANVKRDAVKAAQLDEMGWRVLVIWECETKDRARLDLLVRKIMSEVSRS